MKPWSSAEFSRLQAVDFVLTDVDDTLTNGGQLESPTLNALERLARAEIKVVPVTAASAGWGSLKASMWPVAAVIAENGGVSFERSAIGLERHLFDDPARADRDRLMTALQAAFPDLQPALDAPYRQTCLAFQRYSNPQDNQRILNFLNSLGANGTVNSMWILAWFGTRDKFKASSRLLTSRFGVRPDDFAARVLYAGDSENDEVMFQALPLSVGVSTVRHHALKNWPTWITDGPGGPGFVEIADRLIAAKAAL